MPIKKPWLLVKDPDYFRGILRNMVNSFSNPLYDENVVVRFGLGGEGIRPNYQLEGPPGRILAIAAVNHELDVRAPGGRYDDNMLSEERYTLVQVRDLLSRAQQE